MKYCKQKQGDQVDRPPCQAECILKLCSMQKNISVMTQHEAKWAEAMGSRYVYAPSRMHPKIMLYAKEYIHDDMKHSGQKPGGPGTPTPQEECILKLCSMQRNISRYPTPQEECILKLCSMQRNISVMIGSKAGRSQGVQVPLHPKQNAS
jgi:hypothetical protein